MSVERLLTPAEVAERVGLSTKAVRRAYERGELPASKLCGRVRIRPEDVETWIEGNRIEPVSVPAPERTPALAAPNGLRALL